MRKTKEVLRLRFELGLGQRQIAHCCGMRLATVPRLFGTSSRSRNRLAVARRPELRGTGKQAVWEPTRGAASVRQRLQPDWKAIHEQLLQHRHLTLQLLWEEDRQANPEGYRYSWFCERYQHWRRHLAQKACRDGYSALYLRAPALSRELALARTDSSLRHFLARLSRIDVSGHR